MNIEITRQIVFHSGHMLKDDESKCYHPHGHEYVLHASLGGLVQDEGAENGMVMNFGSWKDILMRCIHDRFDHKFIIEVNDPRYDDFIRAVGVDACVPVSKPPTAENLLELFGSIIQNELIHLGLIPDVYLVRLRLQETMNCWADAEFVESYKPEIVHG